MKQTSSFPGRIRIRYHYFILLALLLCFVTHASAQTNGATQDGSANPKARRPISEEAQVIDDELLRQIDGGPAQTGSLLLPRILKSVRGHHPKIEAARAKQRAARATRLSQEGVYDPLLSTNAQALRGGYYETTVANVELRQYLGVWGSEAYGGYRIGSPGVNDRYPSYEKTETLSGGEVRGGLSVPLWRNGPIDARRANLAIAQDIARAEAFDFQDTELEVRLEAIDAYYQWLAAGHQLEIAERLVKLASTREAQLTAQRDAGSASDFEVIDSRQMVLSRQAAVIAQRQLLQAAAVRVSLYLRDEGGQPVVPDRSRLPPFPAPAGNPPTLNVRQLASCHPQLRALQARADAAGHQADLLANQLAPEARAMLEISRDVGSVDGRSDLAGTNFIVGVELKVPLLFRKERGASDAGAAELASLQHEASWVFDRIQSWAQKIAIDQQAAIEQTSVERKLVAATETLAEGERYRLNAGDTTMLIVNLREMAVAQAAMRLVDALGELHAMQETIRELNRVRCE